MTDVPRTIVPDPDDIPVRHITGVVSSLINGQTIAMNLVTDRLAVLLPDGATQPDLIMAARLRFDLHVARTIRDQLNVHLSGLSSAVAPNDKAKSN